MIHFAEQQVARLFNRDDCFRQGRSGHQPRHRGEVGILHYDADADVGLTRLHVHHHLNRGRLVVAHAPPRQRQRYREALTEPIDVTESPLLRGVGELIEPSRFARCLPG